MQKTNDTGLEAEQAMSFEQRKQQLLSILIDTGIAWGSGSDKTNTIHRWTIDTKAFLLDKDSLKLTAYLFHEKMKGYGASAVGGLTLASHLIACAVSDLSAPAEHYDAFLVRRERKKYNMMKLIEGIDISKRAVIIVDDVLNAAGFATQAIQAVEDNGCTIKAVMPLINFERAEYRQLLEKGYLVDPIFNLRELGLEANTSAQHPDLYGLEWTYHPINASDYSAPKSSPALEPNRVYVGSDQGKLMCLDFSGKLIWEFYTRPHVYGVHQSPIIIDEKLVFSAYDGHVYCLNKDSGALIWENHLSSYSGSSPIYDSQTKTIFVGTENSTLRGTLAALDIESGSLRWEFSTRNHVPCRAAIFEERVFFGSNDGFVYCLEKRTGRFLWKYCMNREVKGRLAIDNGRCYATSFDGSLYCVGWDGKLLWKKKLGITLCNAPLIVGHMVVVGSFSNQVSALDKLTGKSLWHFMTNAPISSFPSLYQDKIYIGSRDGALYVLSLEGTLLWKYVSKGPITSSPACHGDLLFVSGNDGNLYCFKEKGN